MKRILGIGNALVDALTLIPSDEILSELNLPKGSMQLIDETRFADICARQKGLDVKCTTGGSACNTVLAVANLCGEAGLIGCIGKDRAGKFFAENCRAHHINTHLYEHPTLPTGIANTFISTDGQRTFGTFLGAAASLTAEMLQKEWFAGYALVHIEGYLVQNHELLRHAIQMAKECGLLVSLDLAGYNIVEAEHAFFEQLLPQVDIVFANEEESFAYTRKEPREAAPALAEICDTAVVKIGSEGALVACGEELFHQPPLPGAKAIDTTAAGDYFAAGFLHGLANGHSLPGCAALGTLLAGNIVQVIGTALSEDVWQDIRRRAFSEK